MAVALAVFAHSAPLPATQDAPLPPGKEILARHVKAIGGEAAFKALKSVRATGRLEMAAQQISGDFEMLAARPNKQRMRVTITGFGQVESGYDGKIGWRIDPASGPAVLAGKELAEAADDAAFDAVLYGPDFVSDITTVARVQFEGRPAYKVKLALKSGNERFEYFDVESGFQIGSESSRTTQMGVMPVVSILSDYRKFGALMWPTGLVQRLMGIEQVVTITSYEYDVVAADAFGLPPAIKALIK
jgi:hypothetical protein